MSVPPASQKPVRGLAPAIIVFMILLVAALGYYQLVYYPPHHSSTSTTTITDPHSVNVTIVPGASTCAPDPYLCAYSPGVVTVVLGYNATINWFNNESGVEHTVTDNTGNSTSGGGNFATWATTSNDIFYGSTLTYTFTQTGTYQYYCAIHPINMKGVIIVLAGTNSSSTGGAGTTTSVTSASGGLLFHFQSDGSYLVASLPNEAALFANSLATLIGSGTVP